MTTTLALEKLYTDVVARFALDGLAVPQPFGWREVPRQFGRIDGQRIVWVPGDDPGSNLGELLPPKYPGRNPERPLATLDELFTVYITGVAATQTDELAQYKAARLLYDAWWRAVYLAAHGTVRVKSQAWIAGREDPREKRFGASIRVVAAIMAMIPDSPYSFADATTTAEIDATELDVTETVEAP